MSGHGGPAHPLPAGEMEDGSIPPHRHFRQALRLDQQLVVGRALRHALAADDGENRDRRRGSSPYRRLTNPVGIRAGRASPGSTQGRSSKGGR